MNLTADTYHGTESNLAYFSASQCRKLMECAAREIAIMRGEFKPPVDSDALLIGSLCDVELLTPQDAPAWRERHAEDMVSMRTKKPYAWVTLAESMIVRARRDAVFMAALRGEHQRIITFDFAGHPFKCKPDAMDFGNDVFADLKTGPSLDHAEWDDEARTRLPWYDRYFLQIAVYWKAFEHVAGHPPAFAFIAALTKQDPPDIGLYCISEAHRARMDYELERIAGRLDDWAAMKRGDMPATRCGSCDYCRGTKVLEDTDIVEARDWRSENRMRREF